MLTRRAVLKAGAGLALASLLPSWLVKPARRVIDLQAFCDNDCPQHWYKGKPHDLGSPFLQGDWVYATDSRICVQVEPQSGDARHSEHLRPPAAELAWDHDALRGWKPWPNAEPILADGWCPKCDGRGLVGKVTECLPCDGWGCATCRDRGKVGTVCPACKGQASGIFPCLVKVGDHYFDVKYHRKVLALGGVEYAAGPRSVSGVVVRLRFGGGDGLLMPMDRESSEQRIESANLKPVAAWRGVDRGPTTLSGPH